MTNMQEYQNDMFVEETWHIFVSKNFNLTMNKQQKTTIKCKSSSLYVSYNVTDNVTKDVTSDVTNSSDINNGITLCESNKCRKAETSLVTYGVTNNVTQNVTAKEEKKKRKNKFPLHPLKKKKIKKRRKTLPLTYVRA